MPMNDAILAEAAAAAAFGVLESNHQAPPEHAAQVTQQNQQLANAIGKAVAQAVLHIQTYAQATGTVQTTVVTAGSPTAQTGTGVGSSVITPGSIT